jgi:hypothetical protein
LYNKRKISREKKTVLRPYSVNSVLNLSNAVQSLLLLV